MPGGYLEPLTSSNPKFAERRREYLKALVAISPWGAQPPFNSWDDEGLAGLRIPSLFIVGDHDDISGYEQGVKRIFDGAVNSDRCMLVYENANHNVGGNPAPPEALGDFTTRESFDEPVWRKDRITAINQHFITAFLDLYLKGDESRRILLEAGDGEVERRHLAAAHGTVRGRGLLRRQDLLEGLPAPLGARARDALRRTRAPLVGGTTEPLPVVPVQ